MYYLKKEVTIAGAHSLNLNYDSPCTNLHGHNWRIIVYLQADKLNENGMVTDFSWIKEIVKSLDHKNLNSIIPQPTAENIAFYICNKINDNVGLKAVCTKVKVIESDGSEAIYEEDI